MARRDLATEVALLKALGLAGQAVTGLTLSWSTDGMPTAHVTMAGFEDPEAVVSLVSRYRLVPSDTPLSAEEERARRLAAFVERVPAIVDGLGCSASSVCRPACIRDETECLARELEMMAEAARG